MACDVLTLAGIWNSGPTHWQSLWEKKHPEWQRVQHRDWNNPACAEWVAELDAAIAGCEGKPVLVAHSLSCAMLAQWVKSGSQLQIAGAFMVAPADPEGPAFPIEAKGFGPMPLEQLPFPSMVVASANDEYVSLARARQFAQAWGSTFVEIGPAGHVNGGSGYGEWPEGEQMLDAFCARLPKE